MKSIKKTRAPYLPEKPSLMENITVTVSKNTELAAPLTGSPKRRKVLVIVVRADPIICGHSTEARNLAEVCVFLLPLSKDMIPIPNTIKAPFV